MLHKTLEAKATATELGEFTALAATYSVDRTKERIIPGAFKGTIDKWRESGKRIPLHWDHKGEAHNIIGSVDPTTMEETEDGLRVKGQLDLEDSEVARQAWRLMKKNSVALSFGYLVLDDAKAKDGIRELKGIDLFEITITPAPVNPDTRFLDMKSLTPVEMADRLRRAADQVDGDTAATLRTMGDDLASMGRDAERRVLRHESLKRARETTAEGIRAPRLEDAKPEAKSSADVGPGARAHLSNLIKYYMSKARPFTECVKDNRKRFGDEGAKRVCATLKDIGEGSTNWRKSESDEPDLPLDLYRAADGNFEGLIEMWYDHAVRNEEGMAEMHATKALEEEAPAPERRVLRQESLKAARETTAEGIRPHVLTDEETAELKEKWLDPDAIMLSPEVVIEGEELKAAQAGEIKAVWTAAMINDLPDSAFLYVESGDKDEDGKTTPRSKRHFPYKDENGKVDLPHLRNALARIPQSNLSPDVKKRLTSKAQSILDDQKSLAIEGATPEEPVTAKARARDPLRKESLSLARETRTEGLRHVEPPPPPEPEPEPEPSVRELRRRSRQAMLDALRG